jgi:hypothetical protein
MNSKQIAYICTLSVALITSSYYLLCCANTHGYTHNKQQNNLTATQNIATNKHHQIRPLEQKKFKTEFLQHKNYTSAVALFSYGGWTDDGQIWIFFEKNKCILKYSSPHPTSAKFQDGMLKYNYHKVIKSKCMTIKNSFEFTKDLDNYHVANFDAVKYQFVYIRKNNNTIKEIKNIFFDNPKIRPSNKTKPYIKILKLIKSFLH